VQAVVVLHADDGCDGLGLWQVLRSDVGDAQVTDQPGVAQVGQCAEVFRDRVEPVLAQVHDVEVITAQLPQVHLDLAAQLIGPGQREPFAGRIPAGSDLGGDDQIIAVRGEGGRGGIRRCGRSPPPRLPDDRTAATAEAPHRRRGSRAAPAPPSNRAARRV
jgi:hypothetical protein